MSRSTWACELKFVNLSIYLLFVSHAPRERVSWNMFYYVYIITQIVTLHVSVWVEIIANRFLNRINTSRSTWACELKFVSSYCFLNACGHAPRERVSWNWLLPTIMTHISRHAPRERVSWNILQKKKMLRRLCHAPRERVSWNPLAWGFSPFSAVTLHVSVWVEISILS